MSPYSIALLAIPQADIASGITVRQHLAVPARAAAGGTDVTESSAPADRLPLRRYWSVAGRARLRTNLDGMRATLEKMKAATRRGIRRWCSRSVGSGGSCLVR